MIIIINDNDIYYNDIILNGKLSKNVDDIMFKLNLISHYYFKQFHLNFS